MIERPRREGRASRERRGAEADRHRLGRDGRRAPRDEPHGRLDPRGSRQRRVHRLQPRAHALPGAEEQRLHRRPGDPEGNGKLLVGEAAELAQQQRVPLLLRQLGDRAPERGEVGAARRLLHRIAEASFHVDVLDGERLAHPRPRACPALVARDRCEPRCRLARLGAVEQRPVGGEEHLLRRVLRLGPVAQQDAAEPGDHPSVAAVQLLGPGVRPPRDRGGPGG